MVFMNYDDDDYMLYNIASLYFTRRSGRIGRARASCVEDREFSSWTSQPNDLNMYTYHFRARHSTLLSYGKDWLAQCQDNVTKWDSRSWCWRLGLPVGQHCKVTMSGQCHWPDMTLDVALT